MFDILTPFTPLPTDQLVLFQLATRLKSPMQFFKWLYVNPITYGNWKIAYVSMIDYLSIKVIIVVWVMPLKLPNRVFVQQLTVQWIRPVSHILWSYNTDSMVTVCWYIFYTGEVFLVTRGRYKIAQVSGKKLFSSPQTP